MTTHLSLFINRVSNIWHLDNKSYLYTIGYEGLTIDDFINKLVAHNIQILVDVRNNPSSRKVGFSKNALQKHIERVGVRYVHIPELGVPSKLRKNLGSKASYETLFKYYEKKILISNLDCLDKIRDMTSQYSRVALMCFEANHLACHRHKITEYLSREPSFQTRIVHIN